MNISDIDKNFVIKTDINKNDIKFYDVRNKPFDIYGVSYIDGKFRRMPENIALSVSSGVHALHANTAGGRIRFVTDSPYVAISVRMGSIGKMSYMSLCGSAGFDLYVRNNGRENYYSTFVPPYNIQDGYESVVDFIDGSLREITINFPLYSEVKELYVGLSENAKLLKASEYDIKIPVVFYGSSITQGGCVSRPGNAYQSIISRRLNCDFVNLGFAGNARGESEIAEYISTLTMSAFVLDYDHNAPDSNHLKHTHNRMFKIVRNANPDLPIIIMPRPHMHTDDNLPDRLSVIERTYKEAVKAGDTNVYYIDGNVLGALCYDDGTVDGCHPNDFGHASMAHAVLKILRQI